MGRSFIFQTWRAWGTNASASGRIWGGVRCVSVGSYSETACQTAGVTYPWWLRHLWGAYRSWINNLTLVWQVAILRATVVRFRRPHAAFHGLQEYSTFKVDQGGLIMVGEGVM